MASVLYVPDALGSPSWEGMAPLCLPGEYGPLSPPRVLVTALVAEPRTPARFPHRDPYIIAITGCPLGDLSVPQTFIRRGHWGLEARDLGSISSSAGWSDKSPSWASVSPSVEKREELNQSSGSLGSESLGHSCPSHTPPSCFRTPGSWVYHRCPG